MLFYGWKSEYDYRPGVRERSGYQQFNFFEMGIGAPRGPVDFMSDEWQDLYVYAVREAERLKKIFLRAGLGWCSSGGLWVTLEESMKQVVYSGTGIKGNKKVI